MQKSMGINSINASKAKIIRIKYLYHITYYPQLYLFHNYYIFPLLRGLCNTSKPNDKIINYILDINQWSGKYPKYQQHANNNWYYIIIFIIPFHGAAGQNYLQYLKSFKWSKWQKFHRSEHYIHINIKRYKRNPKTSNRQNINNSCNIKKQSAYRSCYNMGNRSRNACYKSIPSWIFKI